MGIKRVIDVDFWRDDRVMEKYTPEDRLFFLYILTNPSTKQCGIYHLPIRTIAFEMGYSKETITSILNRFETLYGNIVYNHDTQEIAILNFLKHSIVKGGKPVEDCIKKELSLVKDKELIKKVYKHMLPYMEESILNYKKENSTSMYVGIKTILEDFIDLTDLMYLKELKDNKNNNKNDNDNERIVKKTIPYDEIVKYLNDKVGCHYKADSVNTKKCIKARFNEGFTYEDFVKVIDSKYDEWGKDSYWSKFLRPETLFGTKFESYLNQKSVHKGKPVPTWFDDYLKDADKRFKEAQENTKIEVGDLDDFFKSGNN